MKYILWKLFIMGEYFGKGQWSAVENLIQKFFGLFLAEVPLGKWLKIRHERMKRASKSANFKIFVVSLNEKIKLECLCKLESGY